MRIDMDQNTIFWPALYLPHLGEGLIRILPVGEHVAQLHHPDAVAVLPQVQPPEAEEHPDKAEEQDYPDPGMDRACPLPAPEQPREEEEAGGEERETGQGKEHEAHRRDPVVDAGARGVAVDRHRIAAVDLIAGCHVVCRHGD
jgi:hypothetical protein